MYAFGSTSVPLLGFWISSESICQTLQAEVVRDNPESGIHSGPTDLYTTPVLVNGVVANFSFSGRGLRCFQAPGIPNA